MVATSTPPTTESVAFDDDDDEELVWSPKSWRQREAKQMPNYEDTEELDRAVEKLSRSAPLVFAGEVRTLHEQLARACQGQGFLLMGGDCAEAFDEFNVDHIRDTYRVLLQMSLVLTFGSNLPVIKVGRMAGQFAKPRSEPDEVRDGVALPSYRGDIINREEFSAEARRHNPFNMVEAYHQSAQTLNILRAFSTGGYADISRLHAWNLDFVEKTDEGSRCVVSHCVHQCNTFLSTLCLDQHGSLCFLIRQVPQVCRQGGRESSFHEGHWGRHVFRDVYQG